MEVPDAWTIESLTEVLPDPTLQWTMPIFSEIAPTRGNESLSRQCERPSWLNKREFLAFCSLRAFPHIQLRRLYSSLRDRSLPLMNPSTHVLVRQMLGHIGELSENSNLHWWSDLHIADFRTELCRLLVQLSDEYVQKTRDHNALLILVDINAYVAQWHPDLDRASRSLAAAVLSWIANISPQMVEAAKDKKDLLRAKQWRRYGSWIDGEARMGDYQPRGEHGHAGRHRLRRGRCLSGTGGLPASSKF